MRPRIPLRNRLVLVGVGSAVVYSLLVWVGPFMSRVWGTSRVLAALAHESAAHLEECAPHPTTWYRIADPIAASAAGPDGRAWAPGWRDLPPEALALPVGEVKLFPDVDRLVLARAVLRTDDPVCTFVVVRHVSPATMGYVAQPLAIGSALGISTVALLTWFFAIRPLGTELRRLASEADRVGTTSFGADIDPTDDDLGRIHRALDSANARILADTSRLAAQRDAVEEHLAATAHDVRTPLATLALVVEELDARHRDDATRLALQEVAYLTVLIDNLNEESRLRAQSAGWVTRVDLVERIERVTLRFARIARVHGAHFSSGVDVREAWAPGDATAIERAIGNLVYNAIVHGPGEVALHLAAADGTFVLSVWDNGTGEPLDGSRSAGLGLGLRITRAVADAHGWRLDRVRTAEGSAVQLSGTLLEPAAGARTFRKP